MKKILFVAICAIASLCCMAKDQASDNGIADYQVQGEGKTSSGLTLVRVSIVAKKANKVKEDDLAKAAVHAVLFRGVVTKSAEAYDTSAKLPPLAGGPEAEAQYADFFKDFFANGDYADYIQYMDDSRRVAKVGKEYNVSEVVAVSDDMLKKFLRKNGIGKKLNTGW